MAVTVAHGYKIARALAHFRFRRGNSAHAHQSAQAQCTLGIAAYWFEILFTAPELNDQIAGSSSKVSSKWYSPLHASTGGPSQWAGSSRGGMSGNSAKPTSASPVANARVLRHRG